MSPAPGDIRVMIVDDSAVIRGLLRNLITRESGIDVVASAPNGRAAIETLRTTAADVVLLDVEMPEMDGLAALPLLLQARPGVRILMASTLTQRGASTTIKALSSGAADYIAKPTSLREGNGLDSIGPELIAKIRVLGRRPGATGPGSGIALRRPPPGRPAPPRLLAIGSSTGGPSALTAVLSALGPEFRLPILITQHMPPTFTTMLAEHLGKDAQRASRVGQEGEPIEPGRIYVAPGDYHMVVGEPSARPVIRLNQNKPENFCRPAVDPLFRSVAAVYGGAAIALILTGMGEDGLLGSKALAAAGAPVVAQDEGTSVVWGMPGAVARAGIATAVLPLPAIADYITKLVRERRDAA